MFGWVIGMYEFNNLILYNKKINIHLAHLAFIKYHLGWEQIAYACIYIIGSMGACADSIYKSFLITEINKQYKAAFGHTCKIRNGLSGMFGWVIGMYEFNNLIL